MLSYNKPNASPATVTAPSTGDAQQVFATNLNIRVGYAICNASGASVYVQELPAGATAPTSAAVVAAPSVIIPAGANFSSGARDLTDVYVAVASGTADIFVQELV